MNIKINIKDKIATVQGSPVIICGNSNYIVNFTFDAEWNNLPTKQARFSWYLNGEQQFTDVEFTGNTVAVPLLTDIKSLYVGVYAGGLHTSTPARIACISSALCGAGTKVIKGDPGPKGDPGQKGDTGLSALYRHSISLYDGFDYFGNLVLITNGAAPFDVTWKDGDTKNSLEVGEDSTIILDAKFYESSSDVIYSLILNQDNLRTLAGEPILTPRLSDACYFKNGVLKSIDLTDYLSLLDSTDTVEAIPTVALTTTLNMEV